MEIESIIISLVLIVFSLGMMIVSIASYLRSKNVKLIFVSLAFLIFLIKGILMALGLFYPEMTNKLNFLLRNVRFDYSYFSFYSYSQEIDL